MIVSKLRSRNTCGAFIENTSGGTFAGGGHRRETSSVGYKP